VTYGGIRSEERNYLTRIIQVELTLYMLVIQRHKMFSISYRFWESTNKSIGWKIVISLLIGINKIILLSVLNEQKYNL